MWQIRLVDLVDILLVAGLVAGLLIWVRRVRVGRIAGGLLALVVLYLAARAAGLSLLSGLFEGSLALFVLIAVVIFQKELRRLFETVSWPGLAAPSRVTSEHALDVVVETLFELATRGVGVLIVIPGKEPIEALVSGGVELQGRISRPLLQSLFDPHSPGHDGAAILDGDRIARFAVHLPLSTNFQELADAGTRHAAALGLSEQCDALCLVVSEERRRVSVARSGGLTVMRGVPELRALLAEVVSTSPEPPQSSGRLPALLRRHWIEAAVSLAVVAGLWFVLIAGSVETEKTFVLPVSLVDVPAGLVLQRVEPEHVSVTFRGTSSELTNARAGDFEVTVDVALSRVGQRNFSIREDDIRRPPSLEVMWIDPRNIHLIATEQ